MNSVDVYSFELASNLEKQTLLTYLLPNITANSDPVSIYYCLRLQPLEKNQQANLLLKYSLQLKNCTLLEGNKQVGIRNRTALVLRHFDVGIYPFSLCARSKVEVYLRNRITTAQIPYKLRKVRNSLLGMKDCLHLREVSIWACQVFVTRILMKTMLNAVVTVICWKKKLEKLNDFNFSTLPLKHNNVDVCLRNIFWFYKSSQQVFSWPLTTTTYQFATLYQRP